MKIFDSTLTSLERSLDVRLVRHNVLAGNVANVDTPGYRPKDLDFAAAMAAVQGSAVAGAGSVSMAATAAGHLDAAGNRAQPGRGITVGTPGSATDLPLVEAGGESPSIDGNKVDLDRTMVAMAENAVQYGASARAATKKLGILKYVASDGNG